MSSISYPIQLVNGQLATTSSDDEVIGQAILSALMTKELERALRPYYGRDIDLFNTYGSLATIATMIKDTVATGLIGYNVTDYRVGVALTEDGQLQILVTYTPSVGAAEVTLAVAISTAL